MGFTGFQIFVYTHIIGISFGIWHPEKRNLVFSQFAHETAGFKSDLFKRSNNLCGMKDIKGEHGQSTNGYESYRNFIACIRDYYLRNRDFNLRYSVDPGIFAQQLKRSGYYTDSVSNYRAGLIHWRGKIPYWYFGGLYGFIGLVGIGLIFGARHIELKDLFVYD